MKVSKLQRSPWIRPIARNHGATLCCAQLGWKAVRANGTERISLLAALRVRSNGEVLGYLDDEQWVLSPVIGDTSLRDEMHKRHAELRKLIVELDLQTMSLEPGSESIVRLSRAMESLVRWEERELFPRIEDGLGGDQVRRLSHLTAKIEKRRPRVALPTKFDIYFDPNSSTLKENLRDAQETRRTSRDSSYAGIRDVTMGIYAFDDDFRGLGGLPRTD